MKTKAEVIDDLIKTNRTYKILKEIVGEYEEYQKTLESELKEMEFLLGNEPHNLSAMVQANDIQTKLDLTIENSVYIMQKMRTEQKIIPDEKKRNEKIIKSSNIFKIEWDENNLWVHYNNESVYQYKDVPENVSIKMGEAESAGSFLHQNIKGKYRYERIN